MNIENTIADLKQRVVEIDKEIADLREQRKNCIIKSSKLQRSLDHINEFMGEKTAVQDIQEISNNLK